MIALLTSKLPRSHVREHKSFDESVFPAQPFSNNGRSPPGLWDGLVNRELLLRNEDLAAENRILLDTFRVYRSILRRIRAASMSGAASHAPMPRARAT
jgi:hypothetical protein